MILCILTDAAWSHVVYSLHNPSLNSIYKLWARIEFKGSVGAMFTCEEWGYHTTTLKFILAHNLPT